MTIVQNIFVILTRIKGDLHGCKNKKEKNKICF